MMHAKRPSGEFLPRARMVPLTMAAILAVATAIECHAQARGIQSFLSWGFSLAYGCALWFWWALVVYLLWRSTSRWPSALGFLFSSSVFASLDCRRSRAASSGLPEKSAWFNRKPWPEAVKAEYRGLD